jgi:hypothetical protein
MKLNFGKFLHSKTGKYLMSVLMGLGLASLFRVVCKDNNCLAFYAPPLEELTGKVHKKSSNKCVTLKPISVKCNSRMKTIEFE